MPTYKKAARKRALVKEAREIVQIFSFEDFLGRFEMAVRDYRISSMNSLEIDGAGKTRKNFAAARVAELQARFDALRGE